MKDQRLIKKINDRFCLNEHQWFFVNRQKLKKALTAFQFPVLVVDLEFFNRSHDKKTIIPALYSEETKSIVYVLEYAVIHNFNELVTAGNYFKMIQSLRVRRRFNDPKYNFQNQYDRLTKDFVHLLLKNKIQSIVVAGSANDKIILEKWINDYKFLFKNQQLPKVITSSGSQTYYLQVFDVYDILKTTMAFANFKKDGSEFYNPKNLKSGFSNKNTIQLPSLKKFFQYMEDLYGAEITVFEDNADISRLSELALEFFSLPEMSEAEFRFLNSHVNAAMHHCKNDVYKLLKLLEFWYYLVFADLATNKYLQKD